MLTKGMSQFLGTMGESIPTDIIHILNPAPPVTVDTEGSDQDLIPSKATRSRRRRHSYHHATKDMTPQQLRRLSAGALESEYPNKQSVAKPQVWIRVPEPDLTTVWTALSGFSTSLDTGNYGVIDAGIRVVRASRYLMSTTGPLRNKW